MTLNQLVLWLAVALAAWFFAGSAANRRRANALARAIYHALEPLGSKASIRPVGTSAFHIEVDEPAGGFRAVQVVCLMEAREFPLAWLWMRFRGHRDRVIVKAHLVWPPKEAAARDPGLRRVIALRAEPDTAHVHLAFGVGVGEEAEIRRAFEWLGRMAQGEAPASSG